MSVFATLSKTSLPSISAPYHHLNVVKDIKEINAVIEAAELDEETSAKLVNAISSLARTYVSDTVDRLT